MIPIITDNRDHHPFQIRLAKMAADLQTLPSTAAPEGDPAKSAMRPRVQTSADFGTLPQPDPLSG